MRIFMAAWCTSRIEFSRQSSLRCANRASACSSSSQMPRATPNQGLLPLLLLHPPSSLSLLLLIRLLLRFLPLLLSGLRILRPLLPRLLPLPPLPPSLREGYASACCASDNCIT